MNHKPHYGTFADEDYGARPYHDMPSVTSRTWGPHDPHEDRFGYAGLGGWGDFREGAPADAARGERRGERSEGGQRGRGPRATRSDAAIADEVYYRLTEDDYIDASEVLVGVENGVVTLTGEVPERRMKYRAEDVIDTVRGVGDIVNRIRVDRGVDSFGRSGEAVRSGDSQKGSGFSSQSPGHGAFGPGHYHTEPTGQRPNDL